MDWKKRGKKLLFPPLWLMVPLSVISAVLLVMVFVQRQQDALWAYGIYALSFYSLTVAVLFFSMVLPKQYRHLRQRIYDNPIGNRYLTDRAFRTTIALYLSFSSSLLYVGIHLWFWHITFSWWFAVLAGYYIIMALMRFLLVRYVRRSPIGTNIPGEWKRARVCAYILLLINLSLSAAVLMILYQNRGCDYPGIMVYVMALYTFYSTIHAMVDIVKYRTLGSPILSTAKIVSLSAALVSMLNLETAMFAQFGGEMSAENQRIFIILTGAGVSITIVTLSILLIANATKEIRRNNHGS